MSEWPGLFIVIEGADGVGTTTQSKLLVDWLKESGVEARYTNEPSDGPYGRLLRRKFLSAGAMPPAAELTLAFAVDRLEHARKVIMPALERGETIVADRYSLSSMVYQHEADPEWVQTVNTHAPTPDLVIVLLTTYEEAQLRMGDRPRDWLEKDVALQRQVHDRYRAYTHGPLSLAPPGCVLAVNASCSKEETQAAVRYLVEMKRD